MSRGVIIESRDCMEDLIVSRTFRAGEPENNFHALLQDYTPLNNHALNNSSAIKRHDGHHLKMQVIASVYCWASVDDIFSVTAQHLVTDLFNLTGLSTIKHRKKILKLQKT